MRSTKVTDRAKALTITLEWERLAKNADELVEAQALKVISGLMERVGSEAIRTPPRVTTSGNGSVARSCTALRGRPPATPVWWRGSSTTSDARLPVHSLQSRPGTCSLSLSGALKRAAPLQLSQSMARCCAAPSTMR